MSSAPQTIAYARHDVTAVLVTHDGERWVGRVIDALAAQERPIQRIVAVDTSSRDGTIDILNQSLGEGRVITRPRDAGFGQAVAFGVGAVFGGLPPPAVRGDPDEPVEWIWIVHDDCEPATDALHYLLALADENPDVGVVGPKVLGWYNSREILEAGLTVAPSGRRETGLDRGEEDQGQHDGQRRVLAVSSAGMLIRRDVWEALRGFDRHLPFMRDDLDFCWRASQAGWQVVVNTDAVVYHAEAAAREQRRLATRVGRAHYLDRAHALYVLLVNMRLARVPLALVRLGLGTLARSFGYLVAKLPEYAVDEVLALGSVVGRFPRLIRARFARHRRRAVKAKELRTLFPPRGSQLRHIIDAVAERLPHTHVGKDRTGRPAAEAGPVADEMEDLEGDDTPIMRRITGQPLVVLLFGLSVLTLLAARQLVGGGRLMGGALLPAPDHARDLWQIYFSSWHPVGVGSGATATPYIGVIAALSTVLFGNASRAVDLLVVGAVPLCGLTAYLAARKVVASRLLRLWAAGAYALLPAVTGAVATGRLGTTVGAILLPIAGLGAVRTIGLDGRPGTWRAAWATGLLLAIITAFVPVAWLIALALAIVAVLLRARSTGARLRLVAVLVTPVFVLLPWSIALFRQPSLIFLEAGLPGPGLSDIDVSPLALLLLHPGGPAMYPVWISAGVLLAGFAALLRSERRGIVTAGWTLTLAGLVVGLFMSRVHVTGPTLITAVPAWPGFATVVMGAGLLLAALIGAEGARDRIAATSFGWQQPLSVGVTVLAVIAPAVAGLWWIRFGADDPVERRNPVVLPQFIAMDGQTSDRPRTLVLRPRTNGLLAYSLLRDVGPRLGDAETAPRRGTYAGLDQIVTQIITGRGQDEVDQLADYAIRYVLLTSPIDGDLVRTLDGVPGLSRISVTEGNALWRIDAPSARLRIIPPQPSGDNLLAAKAPEAAKAVAVPSAEVGAATSVPAGPAGRQLVLAENADSGWRATLDGRPLKRVVYNGWAQAFVLPADGGQLELTHHSSSRNRWLLVQGLAIAVVIVLALPGGRRTGEILAVDETVAVERRRRARAAGLAEEPEYAPAAGAPPPWLGETGYAEPEYSEPGYPEPGYPEPAYSEPAYSEPGYPEPRHLEPTVADAELEVYRAGLDEHAYRDVPYEQIPYEQLSDGQDAFGGVQSPPYGQQVPAQPTYPTGEQAAYVHPEPGPLDYDPAAAWQRGYADPGPSPPTAHPPEAGYDPYDSARDPAVPAQAAPDAVTASYEVVRDEPYPYGGPVDDGYTPPGGYGYGEPQATYLDPTVGPYEPQEGVPGQAQPPSDDGYGSPGPFQGASYEPDTGHIARVRRSGRHAGKPAEDDGADPHGGPS
jgi:GT2 family glycosyltransferase